MESPLSVCRSKDRPVVARSGSKQNRLLQLIIYLMQLNHDVMEFNVVLVVMVLGGWLAGRLFMRAGLPGVLGMLACGIILGVGLDPLSHPVWRELAPILKSFALIVILLRAGLGIRRSTLNRVGGVALRLAIIPCLCEGVAITLMVRWLFGFSWAAAGCAGFMLAAVSPAVVVPAMLNLNAREYGKKRDVPTAVLAGASVDDVFAITLFSLFLRATMETDVVWWSFAWSLPWSVVAGLVPGVLAGWALAWWFERKFTDVRATEKVLVLLMVSALLVQVGEWWHSAALLGIMTLGFVLLERTERVAHEMAAKLSKIWILAEIILFVLVGMAVDVRVAWTAGPLALVVILGGLIARSAGVWLATWRSAFNARERLFCVLAYWPKATVQAALGSAPLMMGVPGGETILALAVLSIIITAPLGLLAIRYGGPRLLSISFPEEREVTRF